MSEEVKPSVEGHLAPDAGGVEARDMKGFRPFSEVCEALLYTLPDNPRKHGLQSRFAFIDREMVTERVKWMALAEEMARYMGGQPEFVVARVKQILRDPTEYRRVLKEKSDKEFLSEARGSGELE